MDKKQGYAILKAVMLENGRGFALGEHPTAPSPYVTWACYDNERGQREYEWGHYGNDLAAMDGDFADRVQDYQRRFGVRIVQLEAPGLYKYYSTQRPVDIGTFPKPPHNAPDEIVNYDQHVPVEGGAFLAWGHLTYTKPLTEKAASDYELRPSPDNPDMQRRTYELAQLKEARPTERKPPIAEQLKEAAKLAEAGRGRAAPKKEKPTGATDKEEAMSQEHNYNKNAKLSVEQNYNHIDGLINNLPGPPPEPEKPLDKVKEPPRRKRSREREDR